MKKEAQLETEEYWILYEKYKRKNIRVLWDNYLSLERDLTEHVKASQYGGGFFDCLTEINFLERLIRSKSLDVKKRLIDRMEEVKKNCLENNDFEFFEGINEERKYFERKFLGEKRDDRKIKG